MAVAVRARRKAERPHEILEAAFSEFTLHGYEATRLEDIAARAGVTKGTIYVYFASKEHLFASLVDEKGKEKEQALRAAIASDGEPTIESIRADLILILQIIANDRKEQELLRLLIAEAARFPKLVDEHFKRALDPVMDFMKRRLERAAKRGIIRNAPALKHPELLLSPALLAHISRMLFADRWPTASDCFIEAAVDMFLNGLVEPAPETASPRKA